MIRFTRINDDRYISGGRFSLVKNKDYYQILLNSRITRWGYQFISVEAAQNFLNSHDYIHASVDSIPMSSDDIEYLIGMYGFESKGNNKWSKDVGNKQLSLFIHPNEPKVSIVERQKGKLFSNNRHTFENPFDAIDYLDGVDACTIIKCASAKEMSQKLVRVKSSNLWAYAMDIKDRHDKTGTLYIQFKGKNGGPEHLYCYYDVPVNLWRKFLGAPSKGMFFWRFIRNNFTYRKLTGDKKTHLRNGL